MNVVWLRNDLRLQDNAALQRAVRAKAPTLFVYILPRSWFEADAPGEQNRIAGPRLRFLRESLQDLEQQLRAYGHSLTLTYADPVTWFHQLSQRHELTIYTQAAEAPEELAWFEALTARNIRIVATEQRTLFPVTLFHSLQAKFPPSFSRFRRYLEKAELVPTAPQTLPDLAQLPSAPSDSDALIWPEAAWQAPDYPGFAFRGGREAGLSRLNDYLFDSGAVHHYKDSRNAMTGDHFSSRFSPWLALGCVSPRQIWAAISRAEDDAGASKHTGWLKQELLWREYFHWSMRAHGEQLFRSRGLSESTPTQPRSGDPHLWQAWCEARTGVPMVDAGLQELQRSGWLSNRLRQNMASYFIHQLKLDWRWGAAWFEAHLIDYDVASNWGNWAYLAGAGHDPRQQGGGKREFSLNRQLRVYDPDAQHIRLWLPALADYSGSEILEHQCGERRLEGYPTPVVPVRADTSDDKR